MVEASTRKDEPRAPEPPRPGAWRVAWLALAVALVGIGIATTCARWGHRDAKEAAARGLAGQLEQLQRQYAATSSQPGGGVPAQLRLDIEAKEKELAGARADRDRFQYFSHGDAERYEEISEGGYRADWPAAPAGDGSRPGKKSPRTNLVWYPLYPLLGLAVAKLTGLSTAVALNVVTDLALLVAAPLFFLMARRHYASRRPTPASAAAVATAGWLGPADAGALWATLLLLLGPASIFLYANFTESLFVLLLAAFLYCLHDRQWWRAAAIAAIASSCRAQGVLFGPVLALSYLLRSNHRSRWGRLGMAGLLGLVSATGLLGYMAYQQAQFGDPLMFIHAQRDWNVGINQATLRHAANPLNAIANFLGLTLNRPEGWGVSWPMVWEAACVIWPPVLLAAWGWRYLSAEQQALGWLLWGLPYVSSSLSGYPPESMKWMSMGRFMAVALPLHLTLGAILVRVRWLGAVLLPLCLAAFALLAYGAGAGWWIG